MQGVYGGGLWGQTRDLTVHFRGHKEGLPLGETVVGLVLGWARGDGGHQCLSVGRIMSSTRA